MSVKTVAVLKTYFETGDVPTESQFGDLIDSFVHKQTGLVITDKSYDPETGAFSMSFSDNTSISFNVNPDLGDINEQLEQLATDISGKVDKVFGKELSSNDFTNELKTKLENLENYEPPTSQPISFIEGLLEALNLKADDNVVVKSVNQTLPDEFGNVNVTFTGVDYDLSLVETRLNYSYFGENVFGILLEIPAKDVNGDYIFNHDLEVSKYLKIEQKEEVLADGIAEALTMPFAVDLQTAVDKYDPINGKVEVRTNDIRVIGYDFAAKYLYLEYLKGAIIEEGISFDAIGDEPIGDDGAA